MNKTDRKATSSHNPNPNNSIIKLILDLTCTDENYKRFSKDCQMVMNIAIKSCIHHVHDEYSFITKNKKLYAW